MTARSLRISGPLAEAMFAANELACRRGGRLLFDDLSFELSPGDCLLLMGPNGSGKSSLLRMLAGYLTKDRGRLHLDGEPLDPAKAKLQMSYVGHANPLKPGLSVKDNIFYLQGHLGHARPMELFDAFGLEAILDMPARYLSSGQKRRTTLAGCLSFERPIWLMDEPGVGLDRDYRGKLEEAISAQLARGGIVIAASHGDVVLPDPLILDFAHAI